MVEEFVELVGNQSIVKVVNVSFTGGHNDDELYVGIVWARE